MKQIDKDILVILKARGELHGLDILDNLKTTKSAPFGFASLYPALNRLEKAGLISWYWCYVSSGDRRKRYEITDLGLSTVSQSLN